MSKEGNRPEEAPTSSEEELRSLVEAIPTLVWRAGPEGNIEYVNRRVLEYLGAPLGELIGWGWMDKIHPDDVAFKVKTWLENLESGNPHDAVCRFRGADGRYRWFEVRGEPLRASDGTVSGWCGVLIDIDDLRKAEEAVRESECKLRQVIETVPSLLWSLGPDGEQTQLSQRALDYIGVPYEDLVRLGWTKFVHPDDLPETAKAFSHAIRTGTSYQAVHRLRRADGQYRWHQALGEPLRDRQGRVIQWYGLSVDIEERKQAEDRLCRSEAYLAEAQRLSRTGSFGWTPSTGELHWSDETFRILEYDPSLKPTIERVLQRTHPDDRAMIRQLIDETSSGEKNFDVLHRLLMPDGSVKFVHVLSRALKDPAGNLEVVGALMDVTENTRLYRDIAEREARLLERTAQLRRSEAYLAEAQSLSHTGSSAYNETAILYWSDENYRIFGFDPREGLPSRKAALDRIHPDDRERVLEEARQAVEQKKDYKLQYRLLLPEETIKYIETNAHLKISASGELVEVVSTIIDVTERRRAEQALRESEYKLRQIIEAVPGLIWSNGPDGEPTHVNQRMLDFSGMRFEDFKLRGWEAFVHPADFPGTAEAFYHAIQTGISHEGVMRLRRADGEYRWHHARCEPLRDRRGHIIQWYGLSVDIEERKQAEDRLRRSEAYLAEAQRLTHIGVAAYSETAILYGSEETYRMWGFDPAQGVPSREAVFRRIHPDDFDRMQAEIQRALGERRRYSIAYRILLPDGTVKHLETIGAPEFSASGELVEIVTTQMDVTERKRAEQALRESEAKFRDYAETTSDWFWEIGRDYKLTLLAGNASSRFPAGRIGTTWRDHALDLETEPEKWRAIQETLDARRPFRDFIYRSVRGDGTPIYVKASGKPVFDINGGFCGYRGTGTDVTATMRAREEHERLRQLEADLAHLNRMSMMGELAATLAHEVKQPVATARNNAGAAMHFLDRTPPDLAEVREALACVVDDAHRAGEIIDRIRDHIRRAPPRNDRFDANIAIAEVIELAQSAITKGGVSMRTQLGEGPLRVQGDYVQLQQVVLNLILNAVEAMSSVEAGARELWISTEQGQAGGVVVAVRDSGAGIDPNHLEQVFEPFYTTKSSGIGMGLAICRSIIDAHGGRLWADANTPRGAVFQFTLPRADDEITNPLQEAHPAREPRAGSVSDTSRQRTSEDSKRRHPAKRARAPRRSDRPSKGSSGSRTPPR